MLKKIRRKLLSALMTSLPPQKNHYLNVAVPPHHPSSATIPSYDAILRMSIDEKIALVEQSTEKNKGYLKDTFVSGFYASLSAMLSNLYSECRGNSEVFAFRSYPFLCEYIFTPSDRIHEQKINNPLVGIKLEFFSMLTLIEYGIRASGLYCGGMSLGRRKYLDYYFSLFLVELYKGLEYLARLYYISTDSGESGRRFKQFLKSFSNLDNLRIDALWECRCGLVHSGCLYNHHRNTIWRFGIDNEHESDTVVSSDFGVPGLKGRHFTIYTKELAKLFYIAKNFVQKDMKEHPEKYLKNDNFFVWIRRYLSMQYLPSEEEMREMHNHIPSFSPRLYEAYLDSRPRIGISKIKVSFLYLARLSFSRKKADFFSRIRDAFSQL